MRVGRYEALREIGRGGSAVVHEGRSAEGAPVAIKVLTRTSPDGLVRFERELRLLATLGTEQGFVPLLDAGQCEEGPYVVLALVDGGTLAERLRDGPLPVDETVELGCALAAALGRAHAKGIVHRDVKPENVLVTRDGVPLISDLGVAKHFAHDAPGASQSVGISRAADLRGTVGYMPPEQMRDARKAGPAADVFALGAVLYECLAGRPAFVASSQLALLTEVENGRCEPLRRVRRGVPRWLEAAITKALALDPADRFADGAAFEAALAAGPPVASRALVLFLVLAGGAALFGAGLLGARALRPPPPAPAPSPLPSAAPLPTPRADPRTEALRLVATATDLHAQRDDARALALLEKALALAPNLAAAWGTRGMVRFDAGELDLALADFDRTLELDPRSAAALVNRAEARRRKRDLAGAIADSDAAIALDSRSARPYGIRGLARLERGERDQARADFDLALARDPDEPSVLADRAKIRAESGDPAGALEDLDRAIALRTTEPLAWLSRGIIREGTGNKGGAEADFGRAIELEPRLVQPWEHRGAIRLAAGRIDEGAGDLEHAVELGSGDARVWANLAYVKLARKDYEESERLLTHALELDPGLGLAWSNRGELRRRRGDLAGASADVDKALELLPRHANTWLNRALVREARKDWKGAIADIERALELEPGHRDAARYRRELEELRSKLAAEK